MRFFVGLHQPSDAQHFDASFISVQRLWKRKSTFAVRDWILDSGAFTAVTTRGGYALDELDSYAERIRFGARSGNLLAAVAQDFMCEPLALARTGLTVADHQSMTIDRYDSLLAADTAGVYVLPVLQGYEPREYAAHVRSYGARLEPGAWVGVGSVCKRNGNPKAIENVLLAIHRERPDLRLHGFGVKKTALSSGLVWSLLATADSQAWSAHERWNKTGRGNDWRAAEEYAAAVATTPVQWPLMGIFR